MAKKKDDAPRRVDHLITTVARPAHCDGCGAPILRGIEGGVPARVDPQPVNALGELYAIIAGRWTYSMRSGELAYRESWNLRAGVPASGVYVAHRCP